MIWILLIWNGVLSWYLFKHHEMFDGVGLVLRKIQNNASVQHTALSGLTDVVEKLADSLARHGHGGGNQ